MTYSIVLKHALPHVRSRPDYAAGVIGGVIAGQSLSVLLMTVTALLLHMDVWVAPKMAYSLMAGPAAVRPGFELGPVLAGLAIHLALSIVYGLVFASLAAGMPMDRGVLGALFGFSLYAVNLVILPALAPSWIGHLFPATPVLHGAAIVEHLVFGLVLAACYRAFRRLPEM
jgi:hypothetical protein